MNTDYSKKADNQASIVKELSGIIHLEKVNVIEDHSAYLEEKYT